MKKASIYDGAPKVNGAGMGKGLEVESHLKEANSPSQGKTLGSPNSGGDGKGSGY
jgi:hypothetical protein